MIQSTVELFYDARNGEKKAFVEIEVKTWNCSPNGINYHVKDFAINNGVRELINEKNISYSWDQINSLNEHLESLFDYTGLNKKEVEYKKVQQALLIETQTRPLYYSISENWILTEDTI